MYAVGGNDGTNSVDSCERFDPVLDKWTMCAVMHYKRAGAGLAELGGSLFVVGAPLPLAHSLAFEMCASSFLLLFTSGGFDNDLPLSSVEQYDPHTNQWTIINSMSVCRGGAGLSALAGRLFVVGGHDGQEYLPSVECYDPSRNWYSFLLSESCNVCCSYLFCNYCTVLYEYCIVQCTLLICTRGGPTILRTRY